MKRKIIRSFFLSFFFIFYYFETEYKMRFMLTLCGLTSAALASEMPLIRLNKAEAVSRGAVCLDGSEPAIYFEPNRTGSDPTKWVLFFKGGGWCYDEEDCAGRYHSELGTTTNIPSKYGYSGVIDNNSSINPTFANFNRVLLWYCDGGSWSGDRSEPISWPDPKQPGKNLTMYMRGHRILDFTLEVLKRDYGLSHAKEVLIAGGSAGGLSTYLHSDYIVSTFPEDTKIKTVAQSGFFLLHNNYENIPLYPNRMRYVFHMQNATNNVNKACIKNEKENPSNCMFANYSYSYTTTPIFPLQSAVDAWQMANIWQGDHGCTSNNFEHCNSSQIADLNKYHDDFMVDLTRSEKFKRNGEGGFVESCLEHDSAETETAFTHYNINGTIERDAVTRWWFSENEPASNHWFLPCKLNTESPHQCNPSCTAKNYICNQFGCE